MYILEEIRKYSEINKAIIFGSRAIGNYKKGSDIDLAITGDKITKDILDLEIDLSEVELIDED